MDWSGGICHFPRILGGHDGKGYPPPPCVVDGTPYLTRAWGFQHPHTLPVSRLPNPFRGGVTCIQPPTRRPWEPTRKLCVPKYAPSLGAQTNVTPRAVMWINTYIPVTPSMWIPVAKGMGTVAGNVCTPPCGSMGVSLAAGQVMLATKGLRGAA